MVIVDGYQTVVSRLRLEGHPEQPRWLSHVNACLLGVKLAMACTGTSSFHLLKTFIERDQRPGRACLLRYSRGLCRPGA